MIIVILIFVCIALIIDMFKTRTNNHSDIKKSIENANVKIFIKKDIKMVNQVTLLGNLTKDPTIRYTPGGLAICNFTLAVNEKVKDQTETLFAPIVCFNKSAENMVKYQKKGSLVCVIGKLKISSYKKDGVTKYYTQIVGNQITYCDRKPSNSDNNQDDQPVYEGEISDDEIPF
ncbi:MAG: single-stranded DNA-binding protein [Immundisolibacteraceae bacterium]|nr:single-stranded DNA-binding protein [Immundisolibacteraceae bacterium]